MSVRGGMGTVPFSTERNAGHIFFDQVDFGHVFSGLLGGWDFDFERMNQ